MTAGLSPPFSVSPFPAAAPTVGARASSRRGVSARRPFPRCKARLRCGGKIRAQLCVCTCGQENGTPGGNELLSDPRCGSECARCLSAYMGPHLFGGEGGRRPVGDPQIRKLLLPVFLLQKSVVPRRRSPPGGLLRATGSAAPPPGPALHGTPAATQKRRGKGLGGFGEGSRREPRGKTRGPPGCSSAGGTAGCARLRSGAEPSRPRRCSALSPPAGAGKRPAAAGRQSPREPHGRCASYEGVPSGQGSGSAGRRGEGPRGSRCGLRLGGEERPTG